MERLRGRNNENKFEAKDSAVGHGSVITTLELEPEREI